MLALTLAALGAACDLPQPASVRVTDDMSVRASMVRPSGATSLGTVILVDGIPPSESGDELALAPPLCEAGWTVVTFQPPGTRDSGGYFSVESTARAILSLAARAAPPVAVVGHSAGGVLSLAAMDRLPQRSCVAVLATPSLDVMLQGLASADARAGFTATFDAYMSGAGPARTRGGTSFLAELEDLAATLSSEGARGSLAGRPFLAVGASFDQIAPPEPHVRAMADALESMGAEVTTEILPDDHGFSRDRAGLARMLIRWLAALCMPSPRDS